MKASTSSGPMSGSSNALLRWCSGLCLLVGLAAISWSVYFWIDAWIYQIVQRRQFEAIVESKTLKSAPFAPDPAPIREGPTPMAEESIVQRDSLKDSRLETDSMLGQLEIPRIGVSVMVVEGDSAAILRRAAGHLKVLPYLGSLGTWQSPRIETLFFVPYRTFRTMTSSR